MRLWPVPSSPLGGADNVVAVTHCTTRLRFVLGDPARVNGPALKAITGVLGWCRRTTSVR